MLEQIMQLLKEEDGQSMVEYGIILALISVVAIGVVQSIGSRLSNGNDGAFDKVDSALGKLNGAK